jgi:uncharacterized membrane-anchored protein
MIQNKKVLMIVLFFPILVLGSIAIQKKISMETGRQVTLPIFGYDPRDLLSGHYLRYTIDYGLPNPCNEKNEGKEGFICLDTKTFSLLEPTCQIFVRGACKNFRFTAGIEKYFVSEELARPIEKMVQSKMASIVLSVSSSGKSIIKDMLIDGTPIHEYLGKVDPESD